MRAYLLAGGLLLAIFGSIAAYLAIRFNTLANTDFTPPPVSIAAATAVTEEWDQYLDAVGTIKAARGVELSAETSGEVTELHFDSGDKVSAGQELIVLNDDVEQASRRSQIAALELAEILFERDNKLIAQKSIPQSQFDRSRADLQQAKALLSETEARIRNKRIDAPFSGTIGIRLVNVGDYLSPGTPIATLQDLSELEIDFTLPSQVTPLLRPGLRAQVRMEAYPDKVFKASLFAIDSKVDPGTRNILVRARLEPGSNLLPGMFVRIQINRDSRQSYVTVPETAVTYSLHGDTIFRLIPDIGDDIYRAEPVVVRLGAVRNGRVAVIEGLSAGDLVVSAGQNKLYRDARVVVAADVGTAAQ